MYLCIEGPSRPAPWSPQKARVAGILLADTDLASRLALQSVLSTAGYAVDSAASASEAVGKLDRNEYQLVLADLRAESEEAGSRLLSYARQKDFRPATALISSDLSETNAVATLEESPESVVRISNENISYLLDRIAGLIGDRADRRIRRILQSSS
jgi:CheY-like chemotaxis protein